MRPKRFFIFLIFFTFSTLQGAETVRVASYNVNNYLATDRYENGVYLKNIPKPESEKEALHAVLLSVKPDILALQEMGDEPYLIELQEDLKTLGLYYPYRYILEGPDPNRHLALLSRYPAEAVKYHNTIPFKYLGEETHVKRGLLEVQFTNAGEEWTLYNAHLKSPWSQNPQDPNAQLVRIGEVRAISKHIPKTGKQLFLGDLNDHIRSKPLKHLIKRLSPIKMEDSRGERWTYYYDKEESYSRVDFALASPDMQAHLASSKGHICDLQDASTRASDHRMIYIDLVFEASNE